MRLTALLEVEFKHDQSVRPRVHDRPGHGVMGDRSNHHDTAFCRHRPIRLAVRTARKCLSKWLDANAAIDWTERAAARAGACDPESQSAHGAGTGGRHVRMCKSILIQYGMTFFGWMESNIKRATHSRS